MPRTWTIAMTGLAALVGAGRPTGAAAPAPVPVAREVAERSLRDVAVAVYDPADPVIYYNPDLMRRFSPELRAFFMAHERAHIALRHTRSAALGLEPGVREQVLQGKELEADCLAARTLGEAGQAASLAAVAFFARMGATHFDAEHPSGSARAARILACTPIQAGLSAAASVSRSR